jgi:hypothetical protein
MRFIQGGAAAYRYLQWSAERDTANTPALGDTGSV